MAAEINPEIMHFVGDGIIALLIPGMVWVVRTVTRMESDISWIKQSLRFSGAGAAMSLHSPHTPEFDALLEAFWHGTLGKDKVPVLVEKLKQATKDPSFDKSHQQFARHALSILALEYKIPIEKLKET